MALNRCGEFHEEESRVGDIISDVASRLQTLGAYLFWKLDRHAHPRVVRASFPLEDDVCQVDPDKGSRSMMVYVSDPGR